jgi:hypothetical protein
MNTGRYKRTPRNFEGTGLSHHLIGDILPEVMKKIESGYDQKNLSIHQGWKEVVGEKLFPMTEVISMVNGILTVKVKNSTLYSLLCQQEKPRLLQSLQKKFSERTIRDIQFRIG